MQVESASSLKERGNVLFTSGEFHLCLDLYTQAIDLLRAHDEYDTKIVPIYTNRATALFKLGR